MARCNLMTLSFWMIAIFVLLSTLNYLNVEDLFEQAADAVQGPYIKDTEMFPNPINEHSADSQEEEEEEKEILSTDQSSSDKWLSNIVANAQAQTLRGPDSSSIHVDNQIYTQPKKPVLVVETESEEVESSKVLTSGGSSRLHTVTYASHGGRDARFCRAVESSIRHEFDLVILGWGVPWKGLSQKLEAAHAYAASLPESDVILFTDAFDVMFTGYPSDILSTFLAEKAPIIFSAECGCWPHVIEDVNVCLHKYPISPTPYRFLNSGTWIGYAKEATAMLGEVIKDAGNNFEQANDQKLVADMYIAGRHGIKLDFYNKLFQSMHMTLDRPLPRCNPVEDVKRTPDGRFFNERTNSKPAVLHFNGGGKPYHLKMESQLWYKTSEHNTPEKKQSLAERILTMPSQVGKTMRFKDICGDYVRRIG